MYLYQYYNAYFILNRRIYTNYYNPERFEICLNIKHVDILILPIFYLDTFT